MSGCPTALGTSGCYEFSLPFSSDQGPTISVLTQWGIKCSWTKWNWIQMREVIVVTRLLDLWRIETRIIDVVRLSLVTQVCNLRVLLESLMHLDPQVSAVARSVFNHFQQMRRLCPFLSGSDMITIVHVPGTSKLHCYSALYLGYPQGPFGSCRRT